MGDGIEVDTADLRAKATLLDDVEFGDPPVLAPSLATPDALGCTRAAVHLLRANAENLAANQRYAETEGRRLAEALRSVAEAYDRFDEAARRSVDGTGPPPIPVLPEYISIPEPTLPEPLRAIPQPLDTEALHVDVAQQLLSDGDGAESLEAAASAWKANGVVLAQAAATLQSPIPHWEGEGADAAYGKFAAYGGWLTKLGQSWQALAQRTEQVTAAHFEAIGEHTPVCEQYQDLLADMGVGNQVATMVEMEKLQHRSEQIRSAYANALLLQPITVDPPPSAVGYVPTGLGAGRGDPRRSTSGSAGHQSPRGESGRTGGTDGPSSNAPPPNRPPSEEPVGGRPASAAGGGPPAGGGTPAGGGSPVGAPPHVSSGSGGGSSTTASRPHSPTVAPASVGAGRHGGSGGGTGRGSLAMPLGPSVGGVSVGPGGADPATSRGAPTRAGAASGGAMGGVGGAPMSGHGRAEGREKRRTPGLSPDEALYVEDRPYTEHVIGARKRRTLEDSRDAK